MIKKPNADELREEYDFTPEQLRTGKRGKYAERRSQGVNSREANDAEDPTGEDGPAADVHPTARERTYRRMS